VPASQAKAIGDQIRALVSRACKELVLEIVKELIKSTPVDTGHARANWVPSIGEPFASEVGDASAQQAGITTVLTFKLGDGVLYVSSNVPYITALNYGHSQQAPAMFVEAAVDRAFAKVNARYKGRIEIGRGEPQ
jgi:hypothetical protein